MHLSVHERALTVDDNGYYDMRLAVGGGTIILA